jgi:hypothetical protein
MLPTAQPKQTLISYFVLAIGVALLLFWGSAGKTRQVDGQVYLAQGQALWLHGKLTIDIPKSQESAFWLEDRFGQTRGRFVPGLAVLLGPGIYAGKLAAAISGCQAALPFMATAWLCLLLGCGCALLFSALLKMGFGAKPALLAALLAALGDVSSWQVAQTIWSESGVLFALGLVWWQTARWLNSPEKSEALKLGLPLGCLPWLHPILWPLALFLTALWLFPGTRAFCPPFGWLAERRPSGAGGAPALPGMLAAVLPLALLLIYNWFFFGSPLRGGYSQESGHWTAGPELKTLLLILLDFLYAHWPALLGALGAIWLLPRKSPWLAAAVIGSAAVHLLPLACRTPEMLTRLLAPQAFLLAPGLAALLEYLAPKWRAMILYILIPVAAAIAFFDYGFLTPPVVINGQSWLLPHCWWLIAAAHGHLWAFLPGIALPVAGIWIIKRAITIAN